MKRFLPALFILTLIAVVLLRFRFGYSVSLAIHHFILAGSLHLLLAIGVYAIIGKNGGRVRLRLAQILGFFYWIFFCLFYTLVIGSNYFWGNTITFDILKQYLGNIQDVLSILPIEQWLIIAAFLFYLIFLTAVYLLIRIKRPAIFHPVIAKWQALTGLKKWLLFATLIIVVILSRSLFINAKRTLHFEQEPITYFWLGPMWEIHTDRLFASQPLRTAADDACIEAVTKKEKNGKLVFIVLVDALRSDHLPMYGYNRNTTPFLDSLYRNGQLQAIPNAYSGSTNTIGGVSSLFFSKTWETLNLSQLNLMQYFKKSGYSTYAFLTGYHSGWYGLSAMYRNSCDYFYESTSAYNHAVDNDLVTLEKIKSTPIQPNSFIYIHLLSTHEIGIRNKPFRQFLPDKIGLTNWEKEPVINHYDNGILQADYVMRELFANLQQKGLLSSSVIFMVGDHGNLLGENGEFGHAGGLHEKLLEVPILLYSQDSSWRINRSFGSLMDIAPSITQNMFHDIPNCWQGLSFYSTYDSVYTTHVSAATVKTDLYNGIITGHHDSVELKIFNKAGVLQSVRQKKGIVPWKETLKK